MREKEEKLKDDRNCQDPDLYIIRSDDVCTVQKEKKKVWVSMKLFFFVEIYFLSRLADLFLHSK